MDLNENMDSSANRQRGLRASEITVKNLADYLKLDFENLTEEEKAELGTFLSSAKAFISEYTGLNSEEIDGHETFL